VGLTALDEAEQRAQSMVGQVEVWTVPTVRPHDIGTWATVTHDDGLLERRAAGEIADVSAMYLVAQLQPHPWPTLDGLRSDGLAFRDSPGARTEDPIAVLHGGGRVELHDRVHVGREYRARREVVAVERKGRPESQFLRITVLTHFVDDEETLTAVYEEHILLRGVDA
jgi:hypothetical protein